MIDFIRVHYRDKSKLEPFILNQENFESVIAGLEYHTGEVLYPYKTKLENVEIVINENGGYVKNSIHKLYNLLMLGEDQNHNDFSYSQMCSMIDYLSDNIIDVNEKKLTQLEVGLNINVPTSAERIIKKSILMHKTERHTALRKFGGDGYLLEFGHTNYIIKIYDKAKQYKKQYPKLGNILRFEIKFIIAIEFNTLGIYQLDDLKSKDNLKRLFKYLLMRFDELVIVDDIPQNSPIPKEDIAILNIYSSFSYWENLSDNKKRQTKMIRKRKYQELLEKYDLLKTKRMLRKQLIQKFEKLINT